VGDKCQGGLQSSTLVRITVSVYYLGLKDGGSLCPLDSFPILSVDAALSKRRCLSYFSLLTGTDTNTHTYYMRLFRDPVRKSLLRPSEWLNGSRLYECNDFRD